MRFSQKAKNEICWIALFLCGLPFIYMLVYGDGGYLQLRRHREDLQELQLQNLRLREQQREFMDRIERLKSDPYEIERLARERYHFARPGDIIINVPEND